MSEKFRHSRGSLVMSSKVPSTPIKAIVARIKQLASGYDIEEHDPSAMYNTDVTMEQILINRKTARVRRVYVVGCPDYRVGWVADCDLKACMICFQKFGWSRFRHHCRACGALVCSKCSPYRTAIPKVKEDGGSRVCTNCFGLRPGATGAENEYLEENSATDLKSPAGASIADSVASQDSNTMRFSVRRKSNRPAKSSEELKWSNELFKFEMEQIPKYETAYRRMRELIPPDISKTNMKLMLSQNIPPDVAQRFWDTRVLWLICMHPDDLAKVHIADLRSKYQAYGLDITEMRAIWYNLRQTNWTAETESGVAKLEWKLGFKSKLDDLAHKEAYGTLYRNETRHVAYEGTENLKLFDPFKPIESRYARSASYFKDADQSPTRSPRLFPGRKTRSHSNADDADDVDISFDSATGHDASPQAATESSARAVNLLTDDVSEITIASDLSPQTTIESGNGLNVQTNISGAQEYPSILSLTPTSTPTFYNFAASATPTQPGRSLAGSYSVNSIRRYPATPSSSSRYRQQAAAWRTPSSAAAAEEPRTAPHSQTRTTMSTLYTQRNQSGGGALDPTAAVATPGTVTRIPFRHGGQPTTPYHESDANRLSTSFSSQYSDASFMTPSHSNQAPARAFGKLLSLIGAGKATGVRQLLKSEHCPKLTSAEASVLLLKCVEDPDSLAEPMDTIALLVEEFGANVNTVDATGKNLIHILFTNPFIGGYLMSRGADILQEDANGWCALSMSFEFGVEWMYEAYLASEQEAQLLKSRDELRILKYVSCLIIGGYCTRVKEILAMELVEIDAELATELLASCRGNFDNMKEPIETFELLESLGAEI